jgi:hypothetical protein
MPSEREEGHGRRGEEGAGAGIRMAGGTCSTHHQPRKIGRGMGGEGAALLGKEVAWAAPPQLGLGSKGGDEAAGAGSSRAPGRSRGASRFEEDSDAEKIERSQGRPRDGPHAATKKQVGPYAVKGRVVGALNGGELLPGARALHITCFAEEMSWLGRPN